MGIAERKEKQKLEIRKMILDASMKLFVEEGFEKVSIRKIADLIEYSPTTVYLYFKDKNEILFSLHEMGFQKMGEYNGNLMEIGNPFLRLHKMGENYIRFGLENPEYYDLMFIQRAPMEVLEEKGHCEWKEGDAALDRLQETIAEAIEKGLIDPGNPQAISMAVWSMVHGLVSLAIRRRFDKLMPEPPQTPAIVMDMMHQSLNWVTFFLPLYLTVLIILT
jgi:AcrR family transcriptional regulator